MKSKIKNGFLAYFDLLGFSELIQKATFDKFDDFSNIINMTVKTGGTGFHYRFFSDSIVVYNEDVSQENFFRMCSILSQINFQLVTEIGLTSCGGLSCGSFTIYEKEENVIFAGQPMVEAVRLEETLDWMGITISPKIIENQNSLKILTSLPFENRFINTMNELLDYPRLLNFLQEYDKIPLKSNTRVETISGFIIAPQLMSADGSKEVLANIWQYHDVLSHLKYLSGVPKVQRKYSNTIEIIQKIADRWKKISNELK